MSPTASERLQVAFVCVGVAAISLPVGMLVAQSGAGAPPLPLIGLVGLAGLVALLSIPPRYLFVGWLALAPFLQGSAEQTGLGRMLIWAFFIAPAILMSVLTIVRADKSVRLTWIDWLPAGYAAYVLASIAMTTQGLRSDTMGTGKAYFLVIALGVVVFYYLVVGPGSSISSSTILVTVLIGAGIQGVLAMLEYATSWNVWSDSRWSDAGIDGGRRVVSTLENPAVLGTFLGVGIALATAYLTWRGPLPLRRLSWLVLLAAVPGIVTTLTRGPIAAAAAAAVLLLLFGGARIVGVSILVATALALVVMLPTIKKTDAYQQRVADTVNVRFRQEIQEWSIQLAARRPVFGWGYGSFDRVKNTSGLSAPGVPDRYVLGNTSHNTYLTVLVELGAVGFLLLVVPFAYYGVRGVSRLRARNPDDWMLAGSLAAMLVIVLSISTFDARFFPFALMLPFVFLAIVRRAVVASVAAT